MISAFCLDYVKNERAKFDPYVCILQISLKYRKLYLPHEKRQYHVKGSKCRSCDWEHAAVRVLVSPWEGWAPVMLAVVSQQPVPCANWCWRDRSAMCMSRTQHSLLILHLFWKASKRHSRISMYFQNLDGALAGLLTPEPKRLHFSGI